ncbi:MAG: cobalamin B12-binding domain-containing protein [Acidobacteria bacterium]|nr:cobalamin B12-binding domain-containing protein [Acidobacteriota bacterium]
MRVLLIQPPASLRLLDKVFMQEPLALEYLGAGLKIDGHEVALLDTRLNPDIEGSLSCFRPDLVGLTGYTSQVGIIRGIARRVKELRPGVTVVVGGHHATVRPVDFNDAAVDFVVIGEGVGALREIVASVEGGGDRDEIRGIGMHGPDDGMIFTEPRPYTDLNELPVPDRSLSEPNRPQYFMEWMKPIASIRTSLGCFARCTFCALWAITGGRYLTREPEAVANELAGIAEEDIFLADDESMCDASRMNRLADLIRTAGIRKRYILYARADTVIRHPQLFRKWREIGLDVVYMGLEASSDQRLRALKKNITIEQQATAAKLLDDLGILLYASFMIDPDFTRDDFRSLAAYVAQLDLKHASFGILTPLPGTELYTQRKHELMTEQPEQFDFVHSVLPTRMPPEEFYAEFASLCENAIPFRYRLRTLLKYAPRRIGPQSDLSATVLTEMRQMHTNRRS